MSLGIPGVKVSKSKTISSEVITINREAARHLLKSAYFPLQRDISVANVERLGGEMRRGWYMEGSPLTFAILRTGQIFLLNGHHSLMAIDSTNAVVDFVAIYVQVDDLKEAGRLYGRFDIHKRRTWGDAYRAADLKSKVDFDAAWINRFGSAIRSLLTGFQGSTTDMHDALLSREFQIRVFEHYIPHASHYINSLAVKNGYRANIFKRAAVMGVGLELFHFQPGKAGEFFNAASEDNGLLKRDPRKQMIEYLREISSYGQSERRNASAAVMLAWNAFFEGERLTTFKPGNVSEFRLAGTPWKRGYDPLSSLQQFVPVVIQAPKPAKMPAIRTGTRQEKSGAVTRISEAKKVRAA